MQRVDTARWRDAVSEQMSAGYASLVTFMAIDDDGLQVWIRLRDASGSDAVIATDAAARVPTLRTLIPAVAWYEREAAELFGISFVDHPTVPLLLAPESRPTMRKSAHSEARQSTPWPGELEPGGVAARRRILPPGVVGGGR